MQVKPVIPWVGGKSRLLKHLLPLIPEHKTYVEPFGGGAAMLFAKEPTKVEVLNDINGELINLYRVVQNHLEEFIRQFKYALTSRLVFQWETMKSPETLTDIQRAARFFYLQKNAFGGKVKSPTFGVSKVSPPRFNILRIEELLSNAHLRLARVLIENIEWQLCISKYDSEESFFFCDPPYWKTEGYGVDFSWQNYEALRSQLTTIEGKMLITLNNHPDILELFKGFIVDAKDIKYTVGGNKSIKASSEVFITNYG